MAKTIIKNTNGITIVKVSGTDVTETISLAADLLHDSESLQGTQKVDIQYVQWNISSGGSDTIKITRNSVEVLNLYQNAGELDLSGNGGYSDATENTQDLVCTVIGTGNLYITLRKRAGYAHKIETAQFGQYDTDVVGS